MTKVAFCAAETMFSHVLLKHLAAKGSKEHCMRPVALAGVTGGFAGWALQVLREAVEQPLPFESISCPVCDLGGFEIFGLRIEARSFVLGILAGLVLGPVIECCYLLRQLWALHLRSLVAVWRPQRGSGYRVIG